MRIVGRSDACRVRLIGQVSEVEVRLPAFLRRRVADLRAINDIWIDGKRIGIIDEISRGGLGIHPDVEPGRVLVEKFRLVIVLGKAGLLAVSEHRIISKMKITKSVGLMQRYTVMRLTFVPVVAAFLPEHRVQLRLDPLMDGGARVLLDGCPGW